MAAITEHRAHLEQGLSQLLIYEFLAAQEGNSNDCRPAEAHVLHFLQMATENIAKAILLFSNPGWDKYRHTGFATIPHRMRTRDYAKKLGWNDFGAYQRFLSAIAPLCHEIERLHPQAGDPAAEGPNVEYPWRGRDRDGNLVWNVPAWHEFGLLSKMRRSLGVHLVNFLHTLITRFDEVF